MLKRFLCLFFLSFTLAFAEFEIDFCDVGQGNGTIVNCPGGPPLLIDAGSRQGKVKKDIMNEMAERLYGLLPGSRPLNIPHLFVFISHGDADHMDCIEGIVKLLEEWNQDLRVRFLLGGRPEHYAGTSKAGFRNLVERHRPYAINQRLYISEHLDAPEGASLPIIKNGQVSIRIFAALNDDDPNTSSLVLKLQYGGKSVLLTGDATRATMHGLSDEDLKIRYFPSGTSWC